MVVACLPGTLATPMDLLARLRAAGHDVVDFGATALHPDDDYPDVVIPLAQAVTAGPHLRRLNKVAQLERQPTRTAT
jgi:ribose 5-phosphate isomerase RpiB